MGRLRLWVGLAVLSGMVLGCLGFWGIRLLEMSFELSTAVIIGMPEVWRSITVYVSLDSR